MIRRPRPLSPLLPPRRADEAATQVTANPLEAQASEQDIHEAHTRIEKAPPVDLPPANEWSDEGTDSSSGRPACSGRRQHQESRGQEGPQAASKDDEGKAPADMVLALCATFAAAAGPMLLATNAGDGDTQRMAGLFFGLFGSLTCLFLLVTGNLWRQKGNVPISVALATVLSMGGTAFVEVAIHADGSAPAVAEQTAAPSAEAKSEDAIDEAQADALAEEPTEEPTEDAETEDAVADAAVPPAAETGEVFIIRDWQPATARARGGRRGTGRTRLRRYSPGRYALRRRRAPPSRDGRRRSAGKGRA